LVCLSVDSAKAGIREFFPRFSGQFCVSRFAAVYLKTPAEYPLQGVAYTRAESPFGAPNCAITLVGEAAAGGKSEFGRAARRPLLGDGRADLGI